VFAAAWRGVEETSAVVEVVFDRVKLDVGVANSRSATIRGILVCRGVDPVGVKHARVNRLVQDRGNHRIEVLAAGDASVGGGYLLIRVRAVEAVEASKNVKLAQAVRGDGGEEVAATNESKDILRVHLQAHTVLSLSLSNLFML
jgi:hypothetical protein